MSFPKSRILSTQQLVRQIIESNRNGERFCFILGSGASVESGIPSGNTLEMRWMNCIMGEADDLETSAMDPAIMRECASNLYEEHLIEHSFDEIEAAWKQAREEKRSISSVYYFDIYKLRFYPNQRNGYRYLERIMESCEPSLGYHTLSLLLTGSMRNNLVITTNFDSLVEDALFLYTDKKPLVVGHESLAGYIESDIQRPIVAKVHRGLMYAPFNSPDTTNRLKDEWREALSYAFNTYTPIVIGYGGGDHSLMAFLEEENTTMRHGVYWCYRDTSGLPEESIQNFVIKKDGYFVTVGGFDALMLEIGKSLYSDEISPRYTELYLRNQYDKRVQQYNTQWDDLNQNPELKRVLQSMNDAERYEEEKRAKENELTAWDYARRGKRALDKRMYQEAVDAYSRAIELRDNFASDYNNRGRAYSELGLYSEAIQDFDKAIELNPSVPIVFSNRGQTYHNMGRHEKAVEDCSKAIEMNPNLASAYNNRGFAYSFLGDHEKAIEDCSKAIELKPNFALAYNNRGSIYNEAKEYNKAIDDLNRAIELDTTCTLAYCNRGFSHIKLGQYSDALDDCTKAIELDKGFAPAYNNRGYAYSKLGQHDAAIRDFNIAIALDPKYANPHYHLGKTRYALREYCFAIDEFTKAIDLNPQYKDAFLGRAETYRALGENKFAENDEKCAFRIVE